MSLLSQALAETYSLGELEKIRNAKVREMEDLRVVMSTSTGAGLSVASAKIMELDNYIGIIQSIINLKRVHGDVIPESALSNTPTQPVYCGPTQF